MPGNMNCHTDMPEARTMVISEPRLSSRKAPIAPTSTVKGNVNSLKAGSRSSAIQAIIQAGTAPNLPDFAQQLDGVDHQDQGRAQQERAQDRHQEAARDIAGRV